MYIINIYSDDWVEKTDSFIINSHNLENMT